MGGLSGTPYLPTCSPVGQQRKAQNSPYIVGKMELGYVLELNGKAQFDDHREGTRAVSPSLSTSPVLS